MYVRIESLRCCCGLLGFKTRLHRTANYWALPIIRLSPEINWTENFVSHPVGMRRSVENVPQKNSQHSVGMLQKTPVMVHPYGMRGLLWEVPISTERYIPTGCKPNGIPTGCKTNAVPAG